MKKKRIYITCLLTVLELFFINAPIQAQQVPFATTVAGGIESGTSSRHLSFPSKVVVDANGYIYVADSQNFRIQKFPPNSTMGTEAITVAGGNGTGNGSTQFGSITGLCVDQAGNIFVSDYNNHRIQKFPPNSNSTTPGITIAGGNGTGNAPNQLNLPRGIFVDNDGNIFVADGANHRIQKFPPNSTSVTAGITVAGGNGAGRENNQTYDPTDVFIDNQGNLFVSESGNHRVQKFPANSNSLTAGITVAGGNYDLSELEYPLGIYVNTSGQLYVADTFNDRVLMFPPGSTSATTGTLILGYSKGPRSYQLSFPTGIFIDNSNQIFVADNTNHRIQRVLNEPGLPVNLINFSVEAINGEDVRVNWQTSNEINNDYFIIERSKDLKTIDSLTKVNSKKESNFQKHNYTITDQNPYTGTSYYRLKQVDTDGSITYYRWVSLVVGNPDYGVFPNPIANDQFTLRLDEPANATIELFNLQGKPVLLRKIGFDVRSVDLKTYEKLPSGVYVLKVHERAQTREHKLSVE